MNLPANIAPSMPALASDVANALFDGAFAGFSSGMRFLRPRKLDFLITGGSSQQQLQNGEVVAVLLGVAPFNHCTWYEREYAPGQEPAAPDLCWIQKTENDFPAALPAEYHHKVMVNGQERWKFRKARRTVWAMYTPGPDGTPVLDLDNPVIFDLTSMSLYGPSDTASNSYKWSGLRGFCERFSSPVAKCSPCMFPMQINIDPKSTVSGVVVFRPLIQSNGMPAYLDQETFTAVINKAQSPTIVDMLTVTETLEWPKKAASAAAQPVAQPVQQPVVQPVAQPVQQPVAQPVTQPVQQPAAQPAGMVIPSDVVPEAKQAPSSRAELLNTAAEILNGAKPAAAQPADRVAINPTASATLVMTPQAAAQPVADPSAPMARDAAPSAGQFRPNTSSAAQQGISNILSSLDNL